MSATPEVRVGLGRGVQARLEAQVPVVQRLRGEQEAGVAVLAGVAWAAR